MPSPSLNLLLDTARKVMQYSYSPYSKYQVGACILSDNEQLFSGTNVENASSPLGLCAEASAISALISSGAKKIQEMLIIGSGKDLCTPCGACRQRIYEFSTSKTLIHLADANGIQKTLSINELLPYAFGPEHLK